MNSRIKLQTIDKKRKGYYRILQGVILVLILSLFVSVFFVDSKLLNIILTICVFSCGLFISFIKEYSISGYIVLDENCIEIKNNNLDVSFNVDDLDSIELKYDGYEGASLGLRSLVFHNGTFNFIVFTFQEKKYSIEILLKKKDIVSVNKIFNYYKWHRMLHPK